MVSEFAAESSDSVGAIAQLGERLHGMQEVGGSIPPGSTTLRLLRKLLLRGSRRALSQTCEALAVEPGYVILRQPGIKGARDVSRNYGGVK